MAVTQPKSYFRDFLFGNMPEGFKGTTGFKGGQLRRLDALNQLMQAMMDTQGSGATAKRDVQSWETGAKGSANQSAIGRGLYNTTVLDSAQRGIGNDAQRMRTNIDQSVQDRINALRSAMASVYAGRFGGSAPPSSSSGLGGLLGGIFGQFAGGFGGPLGKAAGASWFG